MASRCPICEAELEDSFEVCPSCGFRLQGSTQSYKPITLQPEDTPKSESRAGGVFRVISGPQTGLVYSIGPDVTTIGRSPQCSIFLNDMTVSRTHATLEQEGEALILRDDNSFNGVWVNNQNIEAKVLRFGDLIQIGAFCLRYEEAPVQERSEED